MKRRNNILTVFPFMAALFLTIFFQPIFTYALVTEEMKPDYDKDRNTAIEHGQDKYNELRDRLNDSELRILSKATENQFKMTTTLNNTLENTVRKESDLEEKDKEFIADLDKVFLKASKSDQVQYVYIPLNEEMFRLEKDYFYNKDKNKIDLTKYEELKNDFQIGHLNGFSLGYLNSNEYKDQQFLYVKLKIPMNEKILYTGKNTIMLDRDKAFVIDQTKWRLTTNDKNKEIIYVEARLVEKSEVDEQLKSSEKELNEYIAKRLDFSQDREIFKFHELKSLKSGITMERAGQIFYHYLENISEEILKKVFLSETEEGKFSINLYDKAFPNYPTVIGRFIPSTATINFDMSKVMRNDIFSITFRRISMHEFAHAVDYFVLSDGVKGYWSSYDQEFYRLYYIEADSVTEELSYNLYATRNERDYFAEIFSAMHTSSDELKLLAMELVPNSARYITQSVLEAIAKQGSL